jgi:hypothetical protein
MILFLTIACWLGASSLSGVAYADAPPEEAIATSAPSAKDRFRQAYEARYTWDKEFPGYDAEVALKYKGDYYQAFARLMPNLGVALKEVISEEVNQLIANQLQMTATQFQPVAFDDFAQQIFEWLESDRTDLSKIRATGEESEADYTLKGTEIIQVKRTVGKVNAELNTLKFMQTEQGYLPTHFQAIFRDAESGALLEQNDVRDTYQKIDRYYVLTKREIRTSPEQNPANRLLADTMIRFNNVRLLSAAERAELSAAMMPREEGGE